MLFAAFFCGAGYSETLTLPAGKRPAWLQEDGLVMAGSWEPLPFRVRRDGSKGYEPTSDQLAAYAREHNPAMVAQLKALGVNFVMMHAYKGLGLTAEKQSMADAVQFSQLCHDAGMHVGVYNYSGAFGWELFFRERPDAREWVLLDSSAKPVIYESAQYRYYWNRNHPDAQSFYKGLIRFAIRDVKADLLHFDNYNVGPGFDRCSIEGFRRFVRKQFSSRQRKELGIGDLSSLYPPFSASENTPLRRAWLDYSCQSLADSYTDMCRYARSLRSDILLECNPGGPGERIQTPVDHGRLLAGGEAFWDESLMPGYRDGVLRTRIRTYKVGRAMNNLTFAYVRTPLEAAEAMAFNLDCLGCIGWFEYGKLVAMPGSDKPVNGSLAPFVQFFHARRELFREGSEIADVAILRSFPSQVFGESKWGLLTARVEQALIENRVPFQIIYDQQLKELHRYRAVLLAGCVALSDAQLKLLRHFVVTGGQLCLIDPVAVCNEWLQPRSKPGLGDLPATQVAAFAETEDWLTGLRRLCGGQFPLSVQAPLGLCAEVTERSGGRRLVHLINYSANAPVTNAVVKLRLPLGASVKSVQCYSPERPSYIQLNFNRQSDFVEFVVPTVGVYEVAVVEFAAGGR